MKYFIGAAIAVVLLRELSYHFGVSQSAGGAVILLACLALGGYHILSRLAK